MVELLLVVIFGAVSFLPIVLIFWLVAYAHVTADGAPAGRCRGCGYDLRLLGERRECPECGAAFTPAPVRPVQPAAGDTAS